MKKIGVVCPLLFDGYLVLSLDKKWIDKFGKVPEFVVTIDNQNKLHLTTLEKMK
jgi:hypothetical protein